MSVEAREPTEEEVLIRRAVFGRQVESFYCSDIGKYVIARCKELRYTAQQDFKNCDPTDHKQVMRIQQNVKLADAIENWLGEAIGDGLRALNILEDMEQ